jgi:hypothetical protein
VNDDQVECLTERQLHDKIVHATCALVIRSARIVPPKNVVAAMNHQPLAGNGYATVPMESRW